MDLEKFLKDLAAAQRNDNEDRAPRVGESEELARRNRIFRKVAQRLGELDVGDSQPEPDFYSELMPDVIVIRDDQSLLFEAQNEGALELLARVCGFAMDTMTLSERIRVHPCRSPYIIDKLKTAGVTVAV